MKRFLICTLLVIFLTSCGADLANQAAVEAEKNVLSINYQRELDFSRNLMGDIQELRGDLDDCVKGREELADELQDLGDELLETKKKLIETNNEKSVYDAVANSVNTTSKIAMWATRGQDVKFLVWIFMVVVIAIVFMVVKLITRYIELKIFGPLEDKQAVRASKVISKIRETTDEDVEAYLRLKRIRSNE